MKYELILCRRVIYFYFRYFPGCIVILQRSHTFAGFLTFLYFPYNVVLWPIKGILNNLFEPRSFEHTNKRKRVSIECVHCHAIKNKIKNHAVDKVEKL